MHPAFTVAQASITAASAVSSRKTIAHDITARRFVTTELGRRNVRKEINAALADPKIKARLADMGGAVIAGSPVDFGASNQSILPRYVSPMEARNSSSLARINHSEQDVAPLRVRAIS
jgi:hypothetical protein